MRATMVTIIGLLSLGLTASGASGACDPTTLATARQAAEAACERDGQGCSSSSNHGKYVSCIAGKVKENPAAKECRGAVVKCAAKSTCGKPGFVTCCRTKTKNGTPVTKCSIKNGADHCKAPKGGTACAGTQSSCCDACPNGTCSSPSGAFVD